MSAPIDLRWLFTKTCQDVVKKSSSPDLYDKLRMAGLLRQLLVGPRALARLVNRGPDHALEFWYREPDEADRERWESPYGFDASRRQLAVGTVRRTDLDTFLAARVIWLEQWLSVDQLLALTAHAYGGQYEVVPDGVSKEAFVAFEASVQHGAAGFVSIALQEAGGVALRGLIPLAEARPDRAESPRPSAAPPATAGAAGCPFSGALDLDRLGD
ncbi:MAG: hypothetical protein KC543_13485 [Myxococcales bacterium]|nr:hypothetical protein [Myxococcales bacterium]